MPRRDEPLESLEGLTILIVDDNNTNRLLVAHAAESRGMRVRETALAAGSAALGRGRRAFRHGGARLPDAANGRRRTGTADPQTSRSRAACRWC
jgi:hypothetical protein